MTFFWEETPVEVCACARVDDADADADACALPSPASFRLLRKESEVKKENILSTALDILEFSLSLFAASMSDVVA